MRKLLHRISHWLGWNTGVIETWWDGNRLMVGFRCDCGEILGAHDSGKRKGGIDVRNVTAGGDIVITNGAAAHDSARKDGAL